jgi:hypothetical protein
MRMQKKQVATLRKWERAWRSEGRTEQGRAAIPDELWSAAAELARTDGLGRTAVALRLDYGKLKRLMMEAEGVGKKSASPSFMELVAPEAAEVAQCAIEMERLGADVRSSDLFRRDLHRSDSL